MPLLSISSLSTITKCKELPLRASDVFICSYPKSGTTWTQQIVLSLILADKRYDPATSTAAADNTDEAEDTEQEYNHVSGKSVLVLFYCVDTCVQYDVLVICYFAWPYLSLFDYLCKSHDLT